MRRFKKWMVRMIPIAIAIAVPNCTCGGQVGPVNAGAGASVNR